MQYRDEFNAQLYTNSDGATDWSATPWVEVVDGGDPTSDEILVDSDTDQNPDEDYVLIVSGKDGEMISRPVDLALCATGTPTLSFDWRPKDDLTGGKEVYLDLYNPTDGWVQQTVLSGVETTTYTTYSQVVPAAFRVAGVEMRFRNSSTNDKKLYVDNVQIAQQCDVITPGTAAGDPPTLVQATDGYGIGSW